MSPVRICMAGLAKNLAEKWAISDEAWTTCSHESESFLEVLNYLGLLRGNTSWEICPMSKGE